MRAHSALAVGCLVLGLSDVLYLNLAVAPSLLAERSSPGSAGEAAGAEAEPLLAAPREVRGEAGRARALDPELAAQTGAEPEPERGTASSGALARARTESPGSRQPAPGVATVMARSPEPGARTAELARADVLPAEPVHIQFARGRATISPRGERQLDRLLAWLSAEPALVAAIEGHADSQGDSLFNDDLSRRRAERVAAYFEAAGLARARLTVRAFGERRPVDRGPGARANQRNRRVEIRVSRAQRPGGEP